MSSVTWVQWTSKRTGVTKAFAVDAEVLNGKGTVRAINGSVVPEDAEPAKRGTEKDEFCVRILEGRKAKAAAKSERKPRAKAEDKPKRARKAKAAA